MPHGEAAIEALAASIGREWSNVYDRVEIVLTTHDVKDLSARDARLAARVDELASLFGAASH